ncbi:MAG: ATPase [Bacteroidota bacterium]|nr:ATPase [Bacteroidota bacterium]
MILIADSGSTKTEWTLVDKGEVRFRIYTPGINPFYQTTEEIIEVLNSKAFQVPDNVQKIVFYGAGCAFPEKIEIVAKAIAYFSPGTTIEIESDLVGAARALCKHEAGIACILGTGSNSCYYDGNKVVENVSPLGFILGDEGSGAVMGKKLVADYMKKQMPESLREKFSNTYGIPNAQILESVYRKPFPNRFLAGFAPFLTENIQNSYIKSLVADSFRDFIVRNVCQYSAHKQLPVHFIGSVAFWLQSVLAEVAQELDIKIGNIYKSPMDGLINYHQKD